MGDAFQTVITRFGGPPAFAEATGMTVGAAKQAFRRKSIGAEWFSAVARAASERGFIEITEKALAEMAEARRLARPPMVRKPVADERAEAA